MDTTGGIENRPLEEGSQRPDELDAASVEAAAQLPGADDVEIVGVSSSDADAVDGEHAEDADGVVVIGDSAGTEETATDESGGDAPAASGPLAKMRGLGQFTISSAQIKAAWRANSLGRVALMAVAGYVLCVGAAYFFLMQPAGVKLHKVQEQKSILHDYVVIQQAGAAIGSFKDGLMTGDQRLTVMSEVNQMAERSRVKIVGDPDLLLRRDISANFVEYPLRLRIRGSFHEMGAFLSLLESSSRFILVEEVEIISEVASRSSESEASVLLALAAWEG